MSGTVSLADVAPLPAADPPAAEADAPKSLRAKLEERTKNLPFVDTFDEDLQDTIRIGRLTMFRRDVYEAAIAARQGEEEHVDYRAKLVALALKDPASNEFVVPIDEQTLAFDYGFVRDLDPQIVVRLFKVAIDLNRLGRGSLEAKAVDLKNAPGVAG